MTDDNELLELAGRATAGTWIADLHHIQFSAGRYYGFVRADELVPLAAITLGAEGVDQTKGRANAAYIAAACNEVPRLISEKREAQARADALLAENERLREALTEIKEIAETGQGALSPAQRFCIYSTARAALNKDHDQ